MTELVVHSVTADAESEATVVERLTAGGVVILDQQPCTLLVEGDRQAIVQALGDLHGWSISPLTTVPPPQTREHVLKRP
jgi:hypothetical protein